MPVRADLVDDDAREAQAVVEVGKAPDQRGDRLRLALGVDDQHHRQVEAFRQRCCGGVAADARCACRARRVCLARPVRGAYRFWYPVKQPHDAFDQAQVGAVAALLQGRKDGFWPHGPGVEVGAGAASGDAVELGVDVVGPGFEALGHRAPGAQGREQAEGQAGLARAGRRRCQDQAAGHVSPRQTR